MTYTIMAINNEFEADIIFYSNANNLEELIEEMNIDDFTKDEIKDMNEYDLIMIKRSKTK